MSSHQKTDPSVADTSSRVHVFDVVRGFSVISMVAFHLCYDLKFISGVPLSWFAPPLQDIWRSSISWAFVLVAGCMFAWSRDNLKRSFRYLLAALLIYVVTTIVAVDVPISFGVIYCMGACTLTTYILDRFGFRPRGYAPAFALFVVFILLLHISSGWVGIGPLRASVPPALYSTPWLSWLGFQGQGLHPGTTTPCSPSCCSISVAARSDASGRTRDSQRHCRQSHASRSK